MKHIYTITWEQTVTDMYAAKVVADNLEEAKVKAFRGQTCSEPEIIEVGSPCMHYPHYGKIEWPENEQGQFYDIYLCAACKDLFRAEDYSVPEDRLRITEVPTEICDHYDINTYTARVVNRNKEFLANYPQDRPKPCLMLKLSCVEEHHAQAAANASADEEPYQMCLRWLNNWLNPGDLWSMKIYEFMIMTLLVMPAVNRGDLDDIMEYLYGAGPDTDYYNELLDGMREDVSQGKDRNALEQ